MKSIIAIVGMPGTGKSAITEYIKTHYHYETIYFGGYVLNEVTKRGLPINPENEKTVRELLRSEMGNAAIAKISYNDILSLLNQDKTIIIDGLYSFSEYLFFKQKSNINIVLIAVHSNKQIRISRLFNRKIRSLTPEEVEKRDISEIMHLEKGGPIAIADYHIINNGTLNELYLTIDKTIKLLQ